MSLNSKNSNVPKTRAQREETEPFTPLSFKALCLLLLVLIVIPGLFQLAAALRRSPETLPDAGPGSHSLNEEAASPSRADSRPFQSQRRTIAPGQMESAISAPSAAASSQAPDASAALRRLEQVIASASPREQQAAAALNRFAVSGAMSELRHLDRQDVASLAERISSGLSKAELGAVLQQYLGMPADRILAQEDPQATLLGIYDAIAGNRREEVRPSALVITDGADADGRITGQTRVLPSGQQRVFAVFENDRVLEGLDQVMAIWRNPSDDRMVFTEFEPVRRGSAYTYVWLDVESGWPAGQYQVELFHPEAQSLLLASERFSVQ
jgi:hypothetical protein